MGKIRSFKLPILSSSLGALEEKINFITLHMSIYIYVYIFVYVLI